MRGNYIGEIESLIALLEYAGLYPMDARTGQAAAVLLGQAYDCFVIEEAIKREKASRPVDSKGAI
jgi:hypothetical protein